MKDRYKCKNLSFKRESKKQLKVLKILLIFPGHIGHGARYLAMDQVPEVFHGRDDLIVGDEHADTVVNGHMMQSAGIQVNPVLEGREIDLDVKIPRARRLDGGFQRFGLDPIAKAFLHIDPVCGRSRCTVHGQRILGARGLDGQADRLVGKGAHAHDADNDHETRQAVGKFG